VAGSLAHGLLNHQNVARAARERWFVPGEHGAVSRGVLPESARVVKATHLVPFVLAGVVAGRAPAQADTESFNPNAFDLSGALDREVAPAPRGLELAVGGGYTQGVGGAGAAGRVEDVTGAGSSLELDAGLRVSPRVSLGVYGTLARFERGDAMALGSRARGATAGIQAAWHARPSRSLAPWVSVGAGWRGLWLTPKDAAASAVHGLEVLRVQLGVDYRITPGLAVTPVVGAGASVFLVEDAAMPGELTGVHDRQLTVYGFTGVLGRFDLGG